MNQDSTYSGGDDVEMLTEGADVDVKSSVAKSKLSSAVFIPPTLDAESIPTISEQIAQFMTLMQSDWNVEGVRGYIVSYKWLGRVLARGPDSDAATKYGKEALEGQVGPVDNSDIWLDVDATMTLKDEKGQPYFHLRPNLSMGEDFEVVPEEAWKLIAEIWYGQAAGCPVITRYCHNTSSSDAQTNLMFELYPPIFTIHTLPDPTRASLSIATQSGTVKILASRHQRFHSFLKSAKTLAGIDLKTKVRVWRLLDDAPKQLFTKATNNGILTPAQSRSTSPVLTTDSSCDSAKSRLDVDVTSFLQLQLGSQRELIDANDMTHDSNYNGRSTMDFVGLRQSEVILLEEMIGGPAGGEWVSDVSTLRMKNMESRITNQKSTSTTTGEAPKSDTIRNDSSHVNTGVLTRGRTQASNRIRGTVGLSNLGNTCYMNSALQCLRSVEELTLYFLDNHYKGELNTDNPLGHQGNVARAYGKLLQEMYDAKQSGSMTPRNFKHTIGRYGPSFSGYQQQDSQEFLLFLLDGLQEDLNRIHKKPYIEKPDSTDEMVNDPVALRAMADQCWEIYKKRNDSVITDLFAGMYKSTLVCPTCQKVSIIFDPFNNLTLQLPVQNVWSKEIFFFPLQSTPFRIAIDIDKNSSWAGLGDYIAKKLRLDARRLIFAETWQHKLYKIFDPSRAISDDNPGASDVIVCFEVEAVPTNFPGPKRTGGNRYRSYSSSEDDLIPDSTSPMADYMLVSVFNRRRQGTTSTYRQSNANGWSFFGVPCLLVLTRDEAKDFDAIMKKVLAHIAPLSSRDFLKEEESPAPSVGESDTVILDADDASDTKVTAESVKSEEGMIGVSVDDPAGTSSEEKFARLRLPHMLLPDAKLSPAVRQLFEIKLYRPGNELIPVGYQTHSSDGDKSLPTLVSRIPATPVAHDLAEPANDSERESSEPTVAGVSSSSDEDELALTSVLPMGSQRVPVTDEVESESDDLPEIEQIVQRPLASSNPRSNLAPRATQHGLGRPSRAYLKRQYASKKLKRKGPGPKASDETNLEVQEQFDNDPALIRLGEALFLDWTDESYDALFAGPRSDGVENGMADSQPFRGTGTWENMPIHADAELDASRSQRNQRRKSGFSLDDCLDEFGKTEILSENDAWFCPRCKTHRRASKTFELWKAPDILVIHLKRFSTQGRFNNKLDFLVDCPLDKLDLTSRLATPPEEDKQPMYELIAVDNHYGGLGGGHYTACARNFVNGAWYDYNDSSVSSQKATSVVTSAAYLLFYRRVTTKPLGGSYFENLANAATGNVAISQPTSQVGSPTELMAGEGQRLDGSSRSGSSSALREVGTAPQVSDDDSATGIIPASRHRRRINNSIDCLDGHTTSDDDEPLPPYSGPQVRRHRQYSTNAMAVDHDEDQDEDEGIAIETDDNIASRVGIPFAPRSSIRYNDAPAWSFDALPTDEFRHLDDAQDSPEADNVSNIAAEGSSTFSDTHLGDIDDVTANNGQLGFGTPECRPSPAQGPRLEGSAEFDVDHMSMENPLE